MAGSALSRTELWAHVRVMAKPDEWTVSLECPVCGRKGEAVFSEEEEAQDHRAMETLSPGFTARIAGRSTKTTTLLCAECGPLAE